MQPTSISATATAYALKSKFRRSGRRRFDCRGGGTASNIALTIARLSAIAEAARDVRRLAAQIGAGGPFGASRRLWAR
jgi:hypothetical protein